MRLNRITEGAPSTARVSSARMGKRKDPGFSPGPGIRFGGKGLILGVLVTLPHQAFASSRSHDPKQLVIAEDNHLHLGSAVGKVYRGTQGVKFKNY